MVVDVLVSGSLKGLVYVSIKRNHKMIIFFFLYVELSFLGITVVETIYKYNYLVFLSLLNLSFLFFLYFLLFSAFIYNLPFLFPELFFLF
jgi:hypothetical protein